MSDDWEQTVPRQCAKRISAIKQEGAVKVAKMWFLMIIKGSKRIINFWDNNTLNIKPLLFYNFYLRGKNLWEENQ